VLRSAPEATARGVAALALPEWGRRWAEETADAAAILPPQGAGRAALAQRRAQLEDGYRALAAATAVDAPGAAASR